MRVAVLGGTGSFGSALATRLREAGVEVVIGSRDAERAREHALELGFEGATNADAARGADIAVLAVKADGALETARELADALRSTPLLSVAAELQFSKSGVRPGTDARSLAERIQDVVEAPVLAGLHS
ncbi:MAG: NAD(P)-binding domain-containing protein, partial [Gaiellaceae bacterium]